ncbi:unnamed protein product [Boreogadus saida]
MAAIDEYCDSGGSDLELGEREEEEDDNDFAEFQVDWKTDGYLPRNPKQFTRKPGLKQPIAVVETPLDVF